MNEPTIWSGMAEITYTKRPWLGRSRVNIVIAVINAVLRAKIVRGEKDAVFLTAKGGLVFQIGRSSETGTGASAKRFVITEVFGDYVIATAAGESAPVKIAKWPNNRTSLENELIGGVIYTYSNYDAAGNTRTATPAGGSPAGQVLHPSYSIGEFIFASQSSNDTGVSALGEPLEWFEESRRTWVTNPEASGSAAAKMFKITALNGGDYFVAREWDGSVLGDQVSIAKKPEQRPSITGETVDGVAISYSYENENKRVSNDGSGAQTEYCYPRFAVGKIVFASQSENGTGISGVTWVDDTCRFWLARL